MKYETQLEKKDFCINKPFEDFSIFRRSVFIMVHRYFFFLLFFFFNFAY